MLHREFLHEILGIILNHPDLFQHHLLFLLDFLGLESGTVEQVRQELQRGLQLLIEHFHIKRGRLAGRKGVHLSAQRIDFTGDSLPMLIEQIAHRIPPPMRQAAMRLDAAGLEARRTSTGALARGLSGDIEDIVQRCLRKDPGERYRSVDALDADLQRLREGLPISLRGAKAGYRLRKFVARHRIASSLTAALLLSLIASAWIVALQNVRIRAERDQAEEALSLMRDAFLSADPARLSGETVTARQVMDSTYATMQPRSAENAFAFPDLVVTMAEVEPPAAASSAPASARTGRPRARHQT